MRYACLRAHALPAPLLIVSFLVLPATAKDQQRLEELLMPMIENHRGTVAVAVKHLPTGETFSYRADEPMCTASLIKFPLMVATYQAIQDGELSLDKRITLKEDDFAPGSGVLTGNFSPGTEISLRDAIHLMIVFSDNTATNLVIDQVGLDATAKLMEQLESPETKLHSKVFRRDTSIFMDRSKKYGLGSTTAADMIKLLEKLSAGELVDASADDKMLEHLYACDDRAKIERGLPENVKFAHKSGAVSAVRTDAGLMDTPSGKIAICVLTSDNEDKRWTNDNEAELLCGQIGEIVYRHFNADGQTQAPTIARILRIGAYGPLVESLQRTLNARLDPSPAIAVDGDFGPMTESTVMRFQKENGLDPNGEVGPEMWRSLGPLATEDEPVPDPEIVNSEQVEKSPVDPLDGGPYVTCKAWAIADGKTGKLLWGFNDSQPRHPASTTKIMTGYVVACLAEEDPSILEEVVTFTERADQTSGSTAGVQAGEQLSVGDLLYGLLLPSGNDASVALAEHFGDRLADPKEPADGDKDAYELFVEAMNKKAAELGMKETNFTNTHGLTDAEHQTSARDLATLGWHAMQQPTIRERVNTPQYGCTLNSTSGYERNVRWNNTNRLLRIEGYDGVKTGTTGAAGSCLVSRGQRGDDELILVVLGSGSTDGRYADSRNLYRWAWKQLGHE